MEAYITQIDFEKAFDSVEWDFLFKALNELNFGEISLHGLKHHIQILLLVQVITEITQNILH